MNGLIAVVVIFGIVALWEIEKIRKDTTQMRLMMEHEGAAWREACREIVAISRMMEKEIHDQADRRLRRELG